jgi:hypothetical protein
MEWKSGFVHFSREMLAFAIPLNSITFARQIITPNYLPWLSTPPNFFLKL